MRFAIIYSKKDPAGTNIIKQFKKNYFSPEIPIIETKKETIFQESINNDIRLKNIDFLFFASKHESKDKKPSICLHAPGNFRDAKYGGQPGKLCLTSAKVMKYLFIELNKNTADLKNKYNITMEATHHGPLIDKPCCFIEVGSTLTEFTDDKVAEAIARTINSLSNFKEEDWIPSIGIGGPHYCNNFLNIQLNSNYSIGHVIPKYASPITESILKETEKKTKEQVKILLIDWKSFKSEERQELIDLINKLGFKYKRTSEVEK
jgi:D-aminoacyl-tRNA deacylase